MVDVWKSFLLLFPHSLFTVRSFCSFSLTHRVDQHNIETLELILSTLIKWTFEPTNVQTIYFWLWKRTQWIIEPKVRKTYSNHSGYTIFKRYCLFHSFNPRTHIHSQNKRIFNNFSMKKIIQWKFSILNRERFPSSAKSHWMNWKEHIID